MTAVRILALVVFSLGGIYAGLAGWSRTYVEADIELEVAGQGGRVLCGAVEMKSLEACVRFNRQRQVERFFPWVLEIPTLIGWLLLSAGFGVVGGVFTQLKDLAEEKPLSQVSVVVVPLFGGGVALLILALGWLFPQVIPIKEFLGPTTVLFLSLIAGAFSTHLYGWVKETVQKLFRKGGAET